MVNNSKSGNMEFEGGPEQVKDFLSRVPPEKWDEYTVVVQNARFDITVLQTKFGIVTKIYNRR